MSCFICGVEAPVLNGTDHKQVDCSGCGRYRISGTSLKLLEANNWHLDVERSRQWLASNQRPQEVPLINSDVVMQIISDRILRAGNPGA